MLGELEEQVRGIRARAKEGRRREREGEEAWERVVGGGEEAGKGVGKRGAGEGEGGEKEGGGEEMEVDDGGVRTAKRSGGRMGYGSR